MNTVISAAEFATLSARFGAIKPTITPIKRFTGGKTWGRPGRPPLISRSLTLSHGRWVQLTSSASPTTLNCLRCGFHVVRDPEYLAQEKSVSQNESINLGLGHSKAVRVSKLIATRALCVDGLRCDTHLVHSFTHSLTH